MKRPATKASLKIRAHNQILTPLDMFSYCESDVTGIKFFFMSSITIKENVILLQDRRNAAQTVKGTCQLHRFVPQPQGKILVYNTSLQASPPTECIIAKTISLSRVQIEDNTLQIDHLVLLWHALMMRNGGTGFRWIWRSQYQLYASIRTWKTISVIEAPVLSSSSSRKYIISENDYKK